MNCIQFGFAFFFLHKARAKNASHAVWEEDRCLWSSRHFYLNRVNFGKHFECAPFWCELDLNLWHSQQAAHFDANGSRWPFTSIRNVPFYFTCKFIRNELRVIKSSINLSKQRRIECKAVATNSLKCSLFLQRTKWKYTRIIWNVFFFRKTYVNDIVILWMQKFQPI